jgi:hypothetical protein
VTEIGAQIETGLEAQIETGIELDLEIESPRFVAPRSAIGPARQ